MAVHHPAYTKLLEYSTKSCPVKTGRNWQKSEIRVEVVRGDHESALSEEDIAHFADEAKVKLAANQVRLVWYDLIKDKLPKQMKVSPIAAILHKSKAFWSIFDLDLSLRLIPQGRVPSVNLNSEKTAS